MQFVMHARGSTMLPRRRTPALALAVLLGVLCLGAGTAVATSTTATDSTPAVTKPPAAATLEQCVTSGEQAERAATFQGEMTTIPGSAKMEMRVDVLERTPDEFAFHYVTFPGLGVWRTAAPGVKIYKYLKQVTNLSAPAAYRALIRYRWLNAKGKLMKALELRTPRCVEPLHPVLSAPGEATAN
jgi:hypothetical protein